MARFLSSAVGLFGLTALWFAGCSGSTFEAGSGGSGGTESTGGARNQAGSTSAGTTTGGSHAAGTGSGGTGPDTGGYSGNDDGGASNGGRTGGSGGASVAGSGGTSSGGACKQDSDCLQCVYNHAPTSTNDCYCTNCSWKPLTKSECDTNKAAFDKYCSKAPIPCPAIICAAPLEARCDKGMCVSGGGP